MDADCRPTGSLGELNPSRHAAHGLRGQAGLVTVWRCLLKLLIPLEATPGIEPGYTVLQTVA